jgi:hypothetical protein
VLGIVADIVEFEQTCDFSISANIAFASDKVRVGSATAETPNASFTGLSISNHLNDCRYSPSSTVPTYSLLSLINPFLASLYTPSSRDAVILLLMLPFCLIYLIKY